MVTDVRWRGGRARVTVSAFAVDFAAALQLGMKLEAKAAAVLALQPRLCVRTHLPLAQT